MKKKWYDIQIKASGDAVITIYNDIESWGFSDSDFASLLSAFNTAKKITIKMNSWGGDPRIALSIVQMMKMSDARFVTEITRVCASSATLIASHSHYVMIVPEGEYGIHEARAFPEIYMKASELRSLADFVDEFNAHFIEAYTKKTGRSEAEIQGWMDEERLFTAAEAVEFGFADEILVTEKVDPIYYSVAARIFKNQEELEPEKTDAGSVETNNQNQLSKMEKSVWEKIKATFGWPNDDVDAAIQAKQDHAKLSRVDKLESDLADLQAKYDAVETEKSQLQAKLKGYEQDDETKLEAKIKETLDNAVAEFRITASQRPKWEEKLKADFAGTIDLLPGKDAQKPAGPQAPSKVNAKYGTLNPTIAAHLGVK